MSKTHDQINQSEGKRDYNRSKNRYKNILPCECYCMQYSSVQYSTLVVFVFE